MVPSGLTPARVAVDAGLPLGCGRSYTQSSLSFLVHQPLALISEHEQDLNTFCGLCPLGACGHLGLPVRPSCSRSEVPSLLKERAGWAHGVLLWSRVELVSSAWGLEVPCPSGIC